MAPLSSLVDQACEQLGIAPEPDMLLTVNGKGVTDMTQPIRFANIPSGARLELFTGERIVRCASEYHAGFNGILMITAITFRRQLSDQNMHSAKAWAEAQPLLESPKAPFWSVRRARAGAWRG